MLGNPEKKNRFNLTRGFIIVFISILLCVFLFLSPIAIYAQTMWTRYDGNPILNPGSSGEWDYPHVGPGFVLFDSVTYHMWYWGGPEFYYITGYATSPDGIHWTKDALNNPVLDAGPPGSWDDQAAAASSVIFDGIIYHMWYTGYDGDQYRNGYATSMDGITWTKDTLNNPVLDVGDPGEWDDYWVWAPTVIFYGSQYHMWYTGYDGDHCNIGYATSPDGINWTKHPSNPVLNYGSESWEASHVELHGIIFDGVKYQMWYTGTVGAIAGTHRIGYATSIDGVNWIKYHSNPVLNLGSPGSWDDGSVEIPRVLTDKYKYHMWYTGRRGAGSSFRCGYATSLRIADFTVTPVYPTPGIDTVLINAIYTGDTTGFSLYAEIESPDSLPLDTIQLFDDGAHNDSTPNDSIFGNVWPVVSTEERYYFVDYYATVTDTEIFNFDNAGIFTTAGPVVYVNHRFVLFDTIPNPGDISYLKVTLKNDGSTATVTSVTADASVIDTFVIAFQGANTYGDIEAGDTSTTAGWYILQISPNCPADTNIYIILSIATEGLYCWSDTFPIYIYSGIDEKDIDTDRYFLFQNFPNPFSRKTMINFTLPKATEVSLEIYDITGRLVTTLIDDFQNAGVYEVSFDGSKLASGIYFYHLKAGEFTETKKMILLR